MLDARAVRSAIYSRLTSTRALTDRVSMRIYHAIAPGDATYPLVIFHRQAGIPSDAFGARAFLWQTWMVKCIDAQTTSSVAEAVQATLVDAMEAGLTVAGAVVQDVRYLSDIDYLETVDGREYRHHGALIRIALSET